MMNLLPPTVVAWVYLKVRGCWRAWTPAFKQNERWPGVIIKIERIEQIAGFFVALCKAVEIKAVLDKLQYRRKLERLVLDVARPCKRRNNQQRYARSESKIVHSRRCHIVLEAAKVVPCQEDHGRFPVRPLHNSINFFNRPVFANADTRRRMLTPARANHQPTHRGQVAILGVGDKICRRYYVLRPELGKPDMSDSVQRGPYISRLVLARSIVLPG